MMSIKLKALRENAGLSQEELAKKIGVSKSTIGMYEQGKRKPNHELCNRLAAYFNVSLDYLIGSLSEPISSEEFKKYGLRRITPKKFPMVGKIACGKPAMCDNEYETYVEASKDIVADFCLTAQGDSMINARIFDGDVIFIREQPMVENGEVAAVIVNDQEITLKRFYYYPELQRVVLSPENPKYKPLVYENETLDHIRIIGKAIAFMSNII